MTPLLRSAAALVGALALLTLAACVTQPAEPPPPPEPEPGPPTMDIWTAAAEGNIAELKANQHAGTGPRQLQNPELQITPLTLAIVSSQLEAARMAPRQRRERQRPERRRQHRAQRGGVPRSGGRRKAPDRCRRGHVHPQLRRSGSGGPRQARLADHRIHRQLAATARGPGDRRSRACRDHRHDYRVGFRQCFRCRLGAACRRHHHGR